MFNIHCGPMQFWESHIDSDAGREECSNYLLGLSPQRPDQYDLSDDGVPDEEASFTAQISQFGFDRTASTKPPPEIAVVRKISDDVMVNAFVARDMPIQVWMPSAAHQKRYVQTVLS